MPAGDDPFRASKETDVYDISAWNYLIVERIDPLPGSPMLIGEDALVQIAVIRVPKEGMN